MSTTISSESEIPCLSDLLIFPDSNDGRDHSHDAKAARNAMLPLITGIASIGNLLAHVANSDKVKEVQAETLHGIGCLVEELARSVELLSDIAEEADYLHKKAECAAKPSKGGRS